MFDSPMLEVAIGLSFVYLVLSLVATVVVEGWIELFQLKGRMLQMQIRRLLGDVAAGWFYADPRVQVLGSGRHEDAVDANAALVGDPLARMLGRAQAFAPVRSRFIWGDWKRARVLGVKRLPSYIPESTFADVILGWMQDQRSGALLAPSSASVNEHIVALPNEVLESWGHMFRSANGTAEGMREQLVAWFKRSTDRMGGELRRRARLRLVIVGLLLVLVSNADTLRMAGKLYNDPQLRTQLVQVADEIGRVCEANDADCSRIDAQTRQALNHSLERGVQIASQQLLGWSAEDQGIGWQTLFGWLITVVAIGLGADFWFGALQKLLSIRNPKRVAAADVSSRPDEHGESVVTTLRPSLAEPPISPDLMAESLRGMRGFRDDVFDESPVQAFWLAQWSRLAYDSREDLLANGLLAHWGIDAEALLQIDCHGTQALLVQRPGCRIVAFRGTEGRIEDILTDARFTLRSIDDWGTGHANVEVHQGFSQALGLRSRAIAAETAIDTDAWSQLVAALRQGTGPVWFTGHSLGGALAVLAAYRLQHSRWEHSEPRPSIAGVYTFGQPLVGNGAFVRHYSPRLASRTFRYVNHCDVVPLLPPLERRGKAYEHVGQVRYFDALGELHRHPNIWERIVDQMNPLFAVLQVRGGDWTSTVSEHAKQRIGDHGIGEYLRGFERVPEVRALWRS